MMRIRKPRGLALALALALAPLGVLAQPGGPVPAPETSVPSPARDLNMGASVQQLLRQDPDPECSAMRRGLDQLHFQPQRKAALWERYQKECRQQPDPGPPSTPP